MDLDQEPGAAHPRDTYAFQGHEYVEAILADALGGARLHHAWLITGPKGVGKATLAYRFARVALGAKVAGPRPLDVNGQDPVARRVAALSHGDLFVLRRSLNERGKPRSEIGVDDARGLGGFFSLKSGEGGMRVAIVDAADDLNRNAANALLKTLEEPPPRTVLLLISHAPGGLLPTIRSRCRRLDLRPISADLVRSTVSGATGSAPDEAAVRFAAGRPGRAIALAAAGVGPLYSALLDALDASGKQGGRAFLPEVFRGGDRAQRLSLFMMLTRDWLQRAVAVSTGVEDAHPQEGALMARLAAPPRAARLAEAYSSLLALEREAESLDMDATHAFARATRILERAVA
ncbi:MAG: DNA polymerase III subunit delta' [Hyphomonadaceae bacterium]|nr:DNA polymerase III subunit delta' [Hyphomonadaceae bacterium]